MTEWKKRGDYVTLDDYVRFHTGKDYLTFTDEETKNLDTKKYEIKNMDKAAKRLLQAAKDKELVQIVGDYDSDGINSCLILIYLCNELHIPFVVTIPRRMSEGYGFSPVIVNRIPKEAKLLITVDNGIRSHEAIKMVKERGMDVIILDHHKAELDENDMPVLPDADVIIDPEAIPEGCDYTHYCGAGLAFKLARYMLGEAHPLTNLLSGFAAVGTIGDSVELLGDNRVIVKQGMNNLTSGITTAAMKKLLECGRINMYSSASDIAFNIVPVLNAPARLYDDGAKFSLSTLILNKDDEKTIQAVEMLTGINAERKRIVEEVVKSIDMEGLRTGNEHVIFYINEKMPEGIAGIIAGQISQYTGKPVFVMTKTEEGYYKGSARSQSEQYSLFEKMSEQAELFLKFGGHKKAAGFSLTEENISLLKEKLEENIPLERAENNIHYDLEIPMVRFEKTAKEILSLEPFGEGLPTPVIRVKGKIERKYGTGFAILGEDKKHIKFQFKNFAAIAFNQADKFTDPNKQFIDMVGTIGWHYYNGKKTLQMNITDFKAF